MAVKSKTKQRRDDIEIAYFKWEFLRRNSEYGRDYVAFDQKFGTWIREHGRHPDMKDTSDGAVAYYFNNVYPEEHRLREKWGVSCPVDPEAHVELADIQSSFVLHYRMPIPPKFARQPIWVWRDPSPISPFWRLDLYICLAGPKNEIIEQVEQQICIELAKRKSEVELALRSAALPVQKGKRSRLKEYETYLKVWDLFQVKRDPRSVAESLYPSQLRRWDTDPAGNRKNPSNPTVQLVRDQYYEACRLINGAYKDLR